MAGRLNLRKVFLFAATTGFLCVNTSALAAAFQLWEQDAASIGNYHAGTAASADDASTAWYNPAGMMRIKNQQLIIGGDPVLTDFRFKGTVNNQDLINLETFEPLGPQPVTAQGGGNFNFIPFFHYVAPINQRVALGMSIVVPYGLQTDYGTASFVRYAATLSQLRIVDYTPSIAIALTDKLTIGFGVDIEKLNAKFNLNGAALVVESNSLSENRGSSTGYGYRFGILYQFTPQTRMGFNYHSKVTHHVTGNSKLIGPLANDGMGGVQYSDNFKSRATLPALSSLSIFHTFNPQWDMMGSISYTQWEVFNYLTLENVAGISGMVSTNSLVVIIPEHFQNTWNVSVGGNYHPNEKWIIRAGLGYDQSPTQDAYRNLQLPDSNRFAFALGTHYQFSKALGFDLGWTHIMAANTRINNLTQAFGDQITTTDGSVRGNADVYGLQIKWDFV